LHIFEPRYKEMVRTCLDNRQSFGVLLIRRGVEANGPLAEPYRIGCTARILEVEHLADGRLKILTLGESRIRVHSLSFALPYLVGEAALFPLGKDDPERLARLGGKLLSLVRQYMRLLNRFEEVQLDPDGLPEDPIVLAYLAAVLLQVPEVHKQELLGMARSADLLTALAVRYRREIPLMRSQLTWANEAGESKTSLN
jgi:Lon protease-like protein